MRERDERYGVQTARKKEAREGIEGVDISEDADAAWSN